MPKFKTILMTVVLLAVLNAVLALSVPVLDAFIKLNFADELVHTFTEGFRECLIAILGLLGGRATSATGRNSPRRK